MTIWPGVLPTVETLTHLGPYRVDGDILKLDLAQAGFPDIEVSDELYLRELHDVDLEDAEAIAAFTNRHGRLGHSTVSKHLRKGDDIPGDRQLIKLLGAQLPAENDLPWIEWFREVDESDQLAHYGPLEVELIARWGLQHIDTFRAWVLAFRRITTIVEGEMRGSVDPNELTAVAAVLDDLLEPFHPAVAVSHDDGTEDFAPYDPFATRLPRLENLLALQAFNHLAAGNVYRTCGNENCQQRFVHQQGRSITGRQRGLGVVYCSNNCANSQASRNYRSRKKAETVTTAKENQDGIHTEDHNEQG